MSTGNTVSDSSLRPIIWPKKLWADIMAENYFTKKGMMGTEENNIVQVLEDLMDKPGDRVRFPLTTRLTGNGISGDDELEGHEEIISPYYDEVVIGQMRHAVRTTGKLDLKKNCFDIRKDAKNKLQIWMDEFITKQIIFKLCGITNLVLTDTAGTAAVSANATWSNTPDEVSDTDTAAGYGSRYLCADYTNGADHLVVTDTLTPALISMAKLKAKTANPKVQPLIIGGKEYYIMLVHPWQEWDLKQNAIWAQAQREAEVRGKENPLFTGADAIWDGVIIHSHEFMPFLDISGTPGYNFGDNDSGTVYAAVDAFRAVLCGKQACVFAKCQNENSWVEESTDYKNKDAIATGLIGGFQKTTFNSKDYGVVTVDTAATPQA